MRMRSRANTANKERHQGHIKVMLYLKATSRSCYTFSTPSSSFWQKKNGTELKLLIHKYHNIDVAIKNFVQRAGECLVSEGVLSQIKFLTVLLKDTDSRVQYPIKRCISVTSLRSGIYRIVTLIKHYRNCFKDFLA